jgi:osmotically inducible protein OsmC
MSMAAVQERQATTIWTGNLTEGEGKVTAGTGAFSDQKVSLPTRKGASEGNPSPEEYLAAAHSSCLAMNISGVMSNAGMPPERLEVTSKVGFGPKEGGGFMVTHSHVSVSGSVPGISEDQFRELVEKGEETCPVSNAIRGNLEITMDITFEG